MDAVGSHVETLVLRRGQWARWWDCAGGGFESKPALAAYAPWDEDFSVYERRGLVKNPLCRQIADSNASGTHWRSCSVVKQRRGHTLYDPFWLHEILFPKCVADTAVLLLYLCHRENPFFVLVILSLYRIALYFFLLGLRSIVSLQEEIMSALVYLDEVWGKW